MSQKGNCSMWCLHAERLFNLTRKYKINYSSACLVLLEVIINGVLQLPKLFFLFHFFLFLVSSQSRFNIIFFIIIILLFLQRQKGGRQQKKEWEDVSDVAIVLNTKPRPSAVGLVTAPTCHLPPLTLVLLVQSVHRWPQLQPDLISLFLGWHHLLYFFFIFVQR